MHIREHDHRRRRPARLESECSAPLADQRRVLLVGADDDWRLLTSYLFEDAGYTAYAAVDGRHAVRLVFRLLRDGLVANAADANEDAAAGLSPEPRLLLLVENRRGYGNLVAGSPWRDGGRPRVRILPCVVMSRARC